jgi:hypothetical protein
MSCPHRVTVPNKGVELTGNSVRSCVAPAAPSSSHLAYGICFCSKAHTRMTQQRTIKSWGDFIDIADTLLEGGPPTKTHYLFRGQSDATWDLTPSLHRDAKPSKLSAG